ncbi:MAG: LacI family DNA-binding transcriptional regulator [Bacteroidota bacterium]
MKRITIKDLARLLNIAPSTVSRSLSDHPDISEATKNRVKALATELGYRPNHIAVNFRKQHSALIALILPEITMFFFPQIIKAVEAAVRSQGYSLIVLHSQNSLELEIENLELCMQFSVDGILLSLSKETTNLDHVHNLIPEDFPLILFDRVLPDAAYSNLTINDQEVAQQAVELLIQKGHRKICGMFGYENLQISKERHQGFLNAMQKHQLDINHDWILNDRHANSSVNELTVLMMNENRPTAIFAMSDELLIGIYQNMAQLGLRIPEDVAVICISEGYIPNFFFPKVTYVRHSGYEVGTVASEMLLQLLKKKSTSPLRQQIIPQLVIQHSV